jgi:hypothetical protein
MAFHIDCIYRKLLKTITRFNLSHIFVFPCCYYLPTSPTSIACPLKLPVKVFLINYLYNADIPKQNDEDRLKYVKYPLLSIGSFKREEAKTIGLFLFVLLSLHLLYTPHPFLCARKNTFSGVLFQFCFYSLNIKSY